MERARQHGDGFRRKCFAKADWVHAIRIFQGASGPEFEGEDHGTFVRKRELLKILRAIVQHGLAD
jgi:hypothetical protein